MLRSVLGTGLLVTVYRAAVSVAALGGGGGTGRMSQKQPNSFRAERVKIDSKNISKC